MGVGASETSARRTSGPAARASNASRAGPVQRRAAPERIENQRFGAAVDAHQEVSRETDAGGAEAQPAGDLEVEDGQA